MSVSLAILRAYAEAIIPKGYKRKPTPDELCKLIMLINDTRYGLDVIASYYPIIRPEVIFLKANPALLAQISNLIKF